METIFSFKLSFPHRPFPSPPSSPLGASSPICLSPPILLCLFQVAFSSICFLHMSSSSNVFYSRSVLFLAIPVFSFLPFLPLLLSLPASPLPPPPSHRLPPAPFSKPIFPSPSFRFPILSPLSCLPRPRFSPPAAPFRPSPPRQQRPNRPLQQFNGTYTAAALPAEAPFGITLSGPLPALLGTGFGSRNIVIY